MFLLDKCCSHGFFDNQTGQLMVLCLVFHRFSVVLSLTRTDDIKRFLSLCCFESESTLCRMIKIQITLYTLVFACPATGSPSEILPNMALVFEVIYNAIVVRSRNKDILHGRRKKKKLVGNIMTSHNQPSQANSVWSITPFAFFFSQKNSARHMPLCSAG